MPEHAAFSLVRRSFLTRETGIVAAGALVVSIAAVYMGCSQLLRLPALALMQGSSETKRRRKKTSVSSSKTLLFRLILRNMLTDRNRVLVTIISIAGGCVLMVVGFTLRYGISGVPDRQFGGILTYDAEVFYDTGENEDVVRQIESILKENSLQAVNIRKESGVFEIDGTMNAMTMIVADKGLLDGYYSLADIDRGEPFELPDEGILIPRRFREYYRIDIGGKVTVYDTGMNRREIPVAGVFENYYGQLFFLTPHGYEKALGTEPECNCFFIKTSVRDAAAERTMIEQFTSSLNFVVYFMLFIAGVMACFIVANFTVTFIQRKTGELTIMRINGFTSGECIRYVAVDLVVTTVLGTVIGLLLGGFMGARILSVTETPYIQMIREPQLESFLYSALVTFVFSLLTNSVALRRIRHLKLSDMT